MTQDDFPNGDLRHYNRVHVEAQGQMHDISEGGVSIYISADLRIGDTVEIEFTLPYSISPTRAKAVVRNHRHYRTSVHRFERRARPVQRYGLQFVGLDVRQQEALARACKLVALMN